MVFKILTEVLEWNFLCDEKGNDIVDSGGCLIGEVLKANSTLKSLNLGRGFFQCVTFNGFV